MRLIVSRTHIHQGVSVGTSAAVHALLLAALSLLAGGVRGGGSRHELELDTRPSFDVPVDCTILDKFEASADALLTSPVLSDALNENTSVQSILDVGGFADAMVARVGDDGASFGWRGGHTEGDVWHLATLDKLLMPMPQRRPVARSAVNYVQALSGLGEALSGILAESDLLLVWCFDESLSMKDDQEEIAGHMGTLYAELLECERRYGYQCFSAVASFGDKFHRHLLRPTRDLRLVEEAMRSIPTDPTGRERLCEALLACFRHYSRSANEGHQLAIVVVTDETGEWSDAERYVDEVIVTAHRQQARIFFLGREAAFGTRLARMKWNGTVLTIDRGPETPFVRRLSRDAFGRALPLLPSGFGPFPQQRLAHQTGGLFVMLQGWESQLLDWERPSYDMERLARLMPSTEPLEEQVRQVRASPLRQTIVELAEAVDRWHWDWDAGAARLEFPAVPGALCAAAEREEKTAQHLRTFWDEAARRLELVHEEYLRLDDPRWQADYALMRAQVAAFRSRLRQYQALLAQARRASMPATAQLPFAWYIISEPTLPGDGDPIASTALAWLREVADTWRGTPWGAVAEAELRTGLSLRWSPTPHRATPLRPAVDEP